MNEQQLADSSLAMSGPAALTGSEIPELLLEVLVQAMETMAFISPLPLTNAPPDDASPLCRISVTFTGPCSGWLEIAAPRSLGAHMVSNVLGNGGDDAEAERQAIDVLMELGNIACGLLLRKLQPRFATRFSLTPPTSELEQTPGTWSALLAEPAVVALDADGFPLLARLHAHQPGAAISRSTYPPRM